MKKGFFISFVITASLFSSGSLILADDTQSLFEKASYLESSKGDLGAAAIIYRKILADPEAHPELVMRSRFQLATCLLKQGDENGARNALKALIDNLPTAHALQKDAKPDNVSSLNVTLDKISETSLIEISEEELASLTLRGIADKLGKYSAYFPPEMLGNFKVNMEQKLVGIGAMLRMAEEGDRLILTGLIPGSPAEKAKLSQNDEILGVDGTPIKEIGPLAKAISKIRGKQGTAVTLLIRNSDDQRESVVKIVRVPITLAEINTIASLYEDEDGKPIFIVDRENGICAIHLRQFTKDSGEKLGTRLKELLSQGMKGLILDLRDNGGGSLQECSVAADFFIDDQLIVSTKSRHGTGREYRGKSEGTLPDFPMVILVNRNTASAAEILAACLQDHQRAIIIGERTFGKGTVETLIRVEGGGAFKYSTHEFFRPSGRPMRRPLEDAEATNNPDWGVTPNEGFAIEPVKIDRQLSDRERLDHDPVWQKAMATLKQKIGK